MPFYDYACDREHTTEHYFSVADKPFAVKCPRCRGEAVQVILTCPALHTLGTFSRDIDDDVVRRTLDPGDGSYCDPNLGRDANGKYYRVKSRKHREELMAAKGIQEFGETDETRDVARLKRTKPIHVGAGGPPRSARAGG